MNEQGMSQNGWIESPEHNADGNSLTALDAKITDMFPGVTVRKDLVNKVKGNALVPSYVLEFLLSAYATNTDQASIESGVDRVRAILANNYVHREEANLIQSKIREKGSHRIIDRVQVVLNDKTDLYEATFSNLGISQVIVDPSLVKASGACARSVTHIPATRAKYHGSCCSSSLCRCRVMIAKTTCSNVRNSPIANGSIC